MTAARRLPTLAGDGLFLQPLGACAGDAALYAALYGNAEAMHWIGAPLAAGELRRRHAGAVQGNARREARQAVWVLRATPRSPGLGLAGWRDHGHAVEVGVILAAAHRGAGLATAALGLLAGHHFAQRPAIDLLARHRSGHAAAAALMARLGFRQDAGARVGDDTDAASLCQWRLTRADWRVASVPAVPRRLRPARSPATTCAG